MPALSNRMQLIVFEMKYLKVLSKRTTINCHVDTSWYRFRYRYWYLKQVSIQISTRMAPFTQKLLKKCCLEFYETCMDYFNELREKWRNYRAHTAEGSMYVKRLTVYVSSVVFNSSIAAGSAILIFVGERCVCLPESFKKVLDTYETVDIVVNIAGIMDDADWEIMVDVNYVSGPNIFTHYQKRCIILRPQQSRKRSWRKQSSYHSRWQSYFFSFSSRKAIFWEAPAGLKL